MTAHQETGENSLNVLDWEVLNPEGVKQLPEEAVKIDLHPASLSGPLFLKIRLV
jgi:hypothetical protein